MRKSIVLIILACLSASAFAQSKTTEKLHKKYSDTFALFFYNNTLRMINQGEDPEFDALIEDVEKMKFLMINKENFKKDEYQKLIGEYKAESFEEIMTSRHQGRNFDVYMKEGSSKGMILAVNDSSSLYVLDIVGSIPLDKVTKFFSTIDESSEIGKRIKDFASRDKD